MLAVGSVLGGRLRIDQILGAGGMGIVAAATHLELGHRVAVKVLRAELAQYPALVERFLREARAVVQLRTEHVCRVFDMGRGDDGAPYIVMELLEGSDLAAMVARGPLPVTAAVEYVMQACVALAEAHGAGIVHRDLKPANLFVTRRADGGPLVKVLDFGIAKALAETGAQLTQTGGALGSPGYMSPEQVQSPRDVDARTDIWALGVTLYQLLSARAPFAAGSLGEIAVKIVAEPPAPLEVDPALRAVVLRCLEKPRERRYPDVAALAADLVPFGGPDARRIAAQVAHLARGTAPMVASGPAPGLPSGSTPMMASGPAPGLPSGSAPMMPPPSGPAFAPAPASTAPAPGRSRGAAWLAIAGVVGLVAGGLAIAWAVHARGQAAPAPAARDAAPRVASRPIDAARPPDAAPPDAPAPAPPDAAPAAASPDAAPLPADTAPARRDTHAIQLPPTIPPSYAGQYRKAIAEGRANCRKLFDNPQVQAYLSPAAILTCACILGDAKRAQAALDKLPAGQAREGLLTACKFYGIPLRVRSGK